MSTLAAFQSEAGLSDEGLASLISDRTERVVPPERLRRWKAGRTETPKYVREALGLPEPEPESADELNYRLGDEPPTEPGSGRVAGADGDRPSREPGRALEPVVPAFDELAVRTVLVTAYEMVGKGAQYAARPGPDGTKPDYVAAFDAHAERCADAWIALAKHDAKVARVLVSLTAGGPWGNVILIHGSLIATLLVVSGKVKVPEGSIPMAPPPPPPPAEGPVASPHEPTPAV